MLAAGAARRWQTTTSSHVTPVRSPGKTGEGDGRWRGGRSEGKGKHGGQWTRWEGERSG